MNFTNLTFFVFVLAIKTLHFVYCVNYVITDASGMGRQFDGIGGISGGGATSKLLVNYPKQQRNEILDLLFKPNFAASLQIFKVEIGGDGESTDGTESSHMHEPWDEDYSRGYEWWMMREAKQRNPEIKLYGLPWSFPGWLGSGKEKNPYKKPERLANYVLKWVQGAHRVYNFTVDYLGIWNEKKYDATYIKTLRHVLDKNGYSHIQIVASDDGWEVANDMLKDSLLNQAVDIIGTHYMGTRTTVEALLTEKPLWSSEDYSTVNNDVGTGCWARLLNQNYVQGFMTSTISWNVLASYYNDLPYGHDGLMTAVEPWSGHYDITNTIWATAHTTQFTEIGWTYLKHGYGTGFLEKGGSYVSLTCSCHKQLTIIIETMSHNHSLCIRPALPPYSVEKQNITYNLQGNMANITTLNVWYSKLNFDGKNDTIFQQLKPIKIIDGTFSFEAEVDAIYTITTVNRGAEMPNTDIPPSKTFPLPYTDNFESYEVGQEAFNFVPQTGVWEVRKTTSSKHTQVNRQVLLQVPVKWCESSPSPINVGGDFQWSNITTSVDIFIPSVNGTTSVFVATRVDKGGCDVAKAKGIFCHLSLEKQSFIVTTDVLSGDIITGGPVTIKPDAWYTLQLTTQGDNGKCSLNGHQLAAFKIVAPQSTGHGFVAYGTGNFHVADFDNFQVTKSKGEIHPYEFHVV